jgi:hypothetical protein
MEYLWGGGGGVQLGPLGTTASNRPIVPAPGDYEDGEIGGMMIGGGNQSIRRKPAPGPLSPPQTPHACRDANPSRRSGKPATKMETTFLCNEIREIDNFVYTFLRIFYATYKKR